MRYPSSVLKIVLFGLDCAGMGGHSKIFKGTIGQWVGCDLFIPANATVEGTRAKRLRMRKVSIFKKSGCECELHDKNAIFLS